MVARSKQTVGHDVIGWAEGALLHNLPGRVTGVVIDICN